jgi:hypothetical protein
MPWYASKDIIHSYLQQTNKEKKVNPRQSDFFLGHTLIHPDSTIYIIPT